ncbi:methyltransferase, FxLD system [Pseudonocardia sp. TRM90224]|uniref:methyltransferase, FxLD system n=1 Tax=Pseudonocardia sp. TRM90224 TaxID=2812678 RepID=UPI001E388379|nr:methyltransferase, FxLD system [Pseudonocardia sp. TRM90224]
MNDRLRSEMVDRLGSAGTIITREVEAAMRAVPRHLFLPGVEPGHAYADQPVSTKTDKDGGSISAASQPSIVAAMLEQLGCEPGHRVLEIGAGTGYNAALLAHLAGPTGHVTTIDVDDELVTTARANLAAAGCAAQVVLGDGAEGHPPAAPYDRVIATVGTHHVPRTWLDQLRPGGRLVVPLRIRGSQSRSIAFEQHHGTWVSVSSVLAGFMPLRGIAHDTRRVVHLAEGVALFVHSDQDVDPSGVDGVLDEPRHVVWTGTIVRSAELLVWLELWLTTTLANGLSRMPAIGGAAVERLYRWGSMATVDGAALAYLTKRTDGANLFEIGVIGHGKGGATLAARMADAVREWDSERRGQEATFELRPTAAGTSYAAVTRWPRPR